MAALNLEPNASLMIAQAGIFLGTMVGVKHLYIKPYARLRAKREAVTLDRQKEAKKKIEQAQGLAVQIEKELQEATRRAKEMREDRKQENLRRQKEVIIQAREQADKLISDAQSVLQQSYAEEIKKIPLVAKGLLEEVYTKAVSL